MTELHCQGLIFDLDGVLIDSDVVSNRHWKRWADLNQVSFEHIAAIHHGLPPVRTVAAVAPHLDAAAESKVFEEWAADDMDDLKTYEGAYALLAGLPAGRWGIATSSFRTLTLSRLNFLGLPIPDALVTVDDVKNGKPAPDPYLLAAEKLGLAPEHCIVIEDAPAGIRAAKTAGARVIAVTTTNQVSALGEADYVVGRLVDIAVAVSPEGFRVSVRLGG
ncbi:MAG: HAD-IA family hydrolase [Rhodothermales bacterium]|nr:HAD-IA family hydrolase [Rhodothermales bacterium]